MLDPLWIRVSIRPRIISTCVGVRWHRAKGWRFRFLSTLTLDAVQRAVFTEEPDILSPRARRGQEDISEDHPVFA